MTNVTYSVQAAMNPIGPWTTLGKVGSPQTNFTFTAPLNGTMQFYRLLVPL